MKVIIPDWLPLGAANAAQLVLNSKKSGPLQLCRVQRLMHGSEKYKSDIKHIKKMWNRLELSAIKKAKEKSPTKNDQEIKEKVHEVLFMYFNVAVHCDGYHREADLKRVVSKLSKEKLLKVSSYARKIIQEIGSLSSANELLTDVLGNLSDVTSWDGGYEEGTQKEAEELVVRVREIFQLFRALPANLKEFASILEGVAKIDFRHPDTLPKYRTDTEKLDHSILLLKNQVKKNFVGKLTSAIRFTLDLVFDYAYEISDDKIRKT
ncbi:MAG: hypothetical protein P4M14_01085 [Gammaproteobacteria bacterium]|nr:hypothetical protein [Gammaproteobacteria bacterium]